MQGIMVIIKKIFLFFTLRLSVQFWPKLFQIFSCGTLQVIEHHLILNSFTGFSGIACVVFEKKKSIYNEKLWHWLSFYLPSTIAQRSYFPLFKLDLVPRLLWLTNKLTLPSYTLFHQFIRDAWKYKKVFPYYLLAGKLKFKNQDLKIFFITKQIIILRIISKKK